MARDCCWNCKYYIAKGDNEPAILRGADSNLCTFSSREEDNKPWHERAYPTSPGYVCRHYKERFY